MKYSFNFLQIANWIYIIQTKLKNLRTRLDGEVLNKQEAIDLLKSQKKQLELIKDIINKKTKLQGIQPNFLKNLKEIKKEFDIED